MKMLFMADRMLTCGSMRRPKSRQCDDSSYLNPTPSIYLPPPPHFRKPSDATVAVYEHHEESVYGLAWSAGDPWIFASLSYDGRVVVNMVPSKEKYKIML